MGALDVSFGESHRPLSLRHSNSGCFSMPKYRPFATGGPGSGVLESIGINLLPVEIKLLTEHRTYTLRQHEVRHSFPSMSMRVWSFGRRDAGPCDSQSDLRW